MKRFFLGALVALLLSAAVAIAQTSPFLFSPEVVNNMQRPCSFSGKAGVPLAVTATSATTSAAFARGNVRLICSSAVHFRMATASSGLTAVTGDPLLPANTELMFASEADYVAAVRDSADGTCTMVQCR